jgi:hypothetical protein
MGTTILRFLFTAVRMSTRSGAHGLPRILPEGGGRRLESRWLPSRLVPDRHRPRAELQPAHELQVDTLR